MRGYLGKRLTKKESQQNWLARFLARQVLTVPTSSIRPRSSAYNITIRRNCKRIAMVLRRFNRRLGFHGSGRAARYGQMAN